jgi:catalase
MLRKSLLLLVTAALGFSSAVLSSEIYKWTDADGNVHYEDRPVGEDVQRLNIVSSNTDNAIVQASIDARRERETARAEARSKRSEDEQAATSAKAEAEKRVAKCAESRARMESYLQARRLYNENDAGEREYLDESGIMKARERAQEQIQKFCD